MSEADIACTLGPSQVTDRIGDWRAILGHARSRTATDAGMRVEFNDATPIEELARLAQAEQGCCRFFAFAITVDHRGLGLDVTAPSEARGVLEALFGEPETA
jgi:hypothetical protein